MEESGLGRALDGAAHSRTRFHSSAAAVEGPAINLIAQHGRKHPRIHILTGVEKPIVGVPQQCHSEDCPGAGWTVKHSPLSYFGTQLKGFKGHSDTHAPDSA